MPPKGMSQKNQHFPRQNARPPKAIPSDLMGPRKDATQAFWMSVIANPSRLQQAESAAIAFS